MRFMRFFLMTGFIFVISTPAVFASPEDIQRHWSGTAVNTLIDNGVLCEPDDGRFKPDHHITRAEAAEFLAGYIRIIAPDFDRTTGPGITFPDVGSVGHQAEDIAMLSRLKLIRGFPDGSFRPQDLLSREALASMAAKLLPPASLEVTASAVRASDFVLADIENSYAKDAILELASDGFLKGYDDGTFRPEAFMTRGEAAAMLFQMSGLPSEDPVVTLPSAMVISVPYISQIEPYRAWVGCEATSLLMGLKGKGYAADVTLPEFLEAMPKHDSNPAKGFAGSPYLPDKEKKVRTTIFPEKLAEFGVAYGKVSDFSGSSPEELQAELLAGNPVVVYATMKWEKPFYRTYEIEGAYQYLLSNNHAVLVCGYDTAKRQYYISDPYNVQDWDAEYRYWIDAGLFDRIYNERQHAVVIQ